MSVGEKRRLVVPPIMAFGKKGAGDDVPPNATVSFIICLKEIQ